MSTVQPGDLGFRTTLTPEQSTKADPAEFQKNLTASQIDSAVGLPRTDSVQQEHDEIAQRNKPMGDYLSDLLSAGIDSSLEKKLWNFYELASDAPFDPSFNPKDHPELYSDISPMDHASMDAMSSPLMAKRYHDQLKEKYASERILSSSGINGVAVNILANTVDPINVALMVAQPELGAARMIPGTTRAASAVRGLAAGAVAGAEAMTLETLADPSGHWSDVWSAIVAGGALGTAVGAVGAFSGPEYAHMDSYLKRWKNIVHDDPGAEELRAASEITNPQPRPRMDLEGSIGAAYIPEAGETFNPDGVSPETLKGRMDSRAYIVENNLAMSYEEAFNKAAFGSGEKAQAMYEAMSKSPLAPQWERAWNSGSMMLKEDAYKLMENGVGVLRNNKSAIMMKEVDNVGMLQGISHPTEGYVASFDKWLRAAHPEMHPIRRYLAKWNPDLKDAFDREVALARNAVYVGKASEYEGIASDVVARLNKQLDLDAEFAAKTMKETGVNGADRIVDSRGYFGQHVHPDKLNTLLQGPTKASWFRKIFYGERTNTRPRLSYNNLIRGITDSYMSVYPEWSRGLAERLAKAVVRRAKSFAEGIDVDMYRMLSDNGEVFLQKYLTDNLGLSATESTKIVEGLKNVAPESQKAGFLRSTRKLDWSTPLGDSGYQLVDIMNTDIPAVAAHYANRVSGLTALARVGYQYDDIGKRIDMIKEELLASNVKHSITDEDLRNLYQPFIGGPIYGAPPEALRKAISATSLAIYGGMGIAQATETAAGAAAFGMKNYLSAIKTEMMHADPETVQQVKHLVSGVRGEENLFLEAFQYNQFMRDAPALQELNSWIDRGLAAGRNIQGIISGFYYVRQIQQKAGIRCMINALADTFDGIQTVSKARLDDIGATAESQARLSKYFTGDTKVVTRSIKDGVSSIDLNLEKWDPSDRMEFAVLLNRSVNQIVQKAMLGERIPWMSKWVGASMMQGKGFTMLSISKQSLRTWKLGNEATAMAVIYGTTLGAAGYVASRVGSGTTEGLDPVSIVKGAISNSNMTSWAPMLWDTPMALLGMNNLKLNNYSFNPRNDIIGVPPAITTLNSQLHLPFVPVHTVTGTLSGTDRAALKSMPLIGNLPFFKALWNQVGE